MAIFPGEPWLDSSIETDDDGSDHDNWSYKLSKMQSFVTYLF